MDDTDARADVRADREARRRCLWCYREREYRALLKSPNFPVDFPCRHPANQENEHGA